MGLPGCPTFTDIRTAIATHVSSDAYCVCVCVCVYVYTPKSLAMLSSLCPGQEQPQAGRTVQDLPVHVSRHFHCRQVLCSKPEPEAGGGTSPAF